jgi:hypothetical protein
MYKYMQNLQAQKKCKNTILHLRKHSSSNLVKIMLNKTKINSFHILWQANQNSTNSTFYMLILY